MPVEPPNGMTLLRGLMLVPVRRALSALRLRAPLGALSLLTVVACADDPATSPALEPAGAALSLTGLNSTASLISTRINGGLCIAADNGTLQANTKIELGNCGDAGALKLALNGNGELRVGGTSLCLDIPGGRAVDGGSVMLYGCHGGSNQRWTKTAADEIRGMGKCLDVNEGRNAAGAAIILYRCHNGINQKWDTKSTTSPPTPAPGDTATPAPTPVPGGEQLYGLHMDLTWNDGASWRAAAVGRAQAVGSRVSRNSFLWHRIEPVRGQKNWSTPDAVVREVRAAGMEPVFAIYGSPLWANGQASSVSDAYLYVPQDGAAFSRWVAEYAAFVREAVTRYRGQVTKWELWNEQNEHYFWKPAPNLDRYAEWYRAVYAAAKAADPSAQIAMGGMAGVAYSGAQDIAGRTFLAGLYQRGIYPDIVNIHPYPIQNQAPDVTIQFENNFTDIATIKAVMDQHGQGNKPMWVTEWGWNLGAVSEAQQATYVQRSLEMLASRYPYVTLATYFQDMDVGGYRYGLYRGDGSARPAATSFKNFMNGR